MKGIVFTEFIEMVEDNFSMELADEIIENAHLESGGAYTTLGTYDHREMLKLVSQLSRSSGIPESDLVRVFGVHLCGRFADTYPDMFADADDTFGFLGQIENHIHVEVRKLYPDAQLPSFVYEYPSENQLIMTYSSTRPFAALADGLIQGAIKHYGEDIGIEIEDLSDGAGTSARFLLTKQRPSSEQAQ
jgi:hypothetical protein